MASVLAPHSAKAQPVIAERFNRMICDCPGYARSSGPGIVQEIGALGRSVLRSSSNGVDTTVQGAANLFDTRFNALQGNPSPENSGKGGRRALYVIGGALIGGTAMAAGLTLLPAGDAITTPSSIAPAVAGGAIIGGVVGWLVYEIKH